MTTFDELIKLDALPPYLEGVPLVDGRPGHGMTDPITVAKDSTGHYRKKARAVVRAARLEHDVTCLTPHGIMDGHAGDWLVINLGNGEAWPVDPDYMAANYEPAPDVDECGEPQVVHDPTTATGETAAPTLGDLHDAIDRVVGTLDQVRADAGHGPGGRELAVAVTHLQTGAMWLAAAVTALPDHAYLLSTPAIQDHYDRLAQERLFA